MARTGSVWWGEHRVGTLSEGHGALLYFRYDHTWLSEGGFAVSVSVPTANGTESVEAHSYFSGLLPEGQTRLRLCRQLGIDAQDDAGLLFAIGGDCAGALSILPEGETPADEAESASAPLSETEFAALVRYHGSLPGSGSDYRQRFSLAGAQEKFTIVKGDSGYRWPSAGVPSTHLVKLETVPHVCFSEYVTNQLAAEAGLPSLNMAFCRLPPSGRSSEQRPYLMVERYDRLSPGEGSGRVRRLHQEDMTQALGYPSSLKYEYDGGPSLDTIAALVRDTVNAPVKAINALRDWQIFNAVAGNWDGHAKNLALLYDPGTPVPSLAPFYDLVSIEFINKVGHADFARDMALSVGGMFRPETLNRQAWEQFARSMRLPPRTVLQRVQEMAETLPAHAESVLDAFERAEGSHPIHARYLRMIEKRCKWTLQLFS